MLFTSTAGFQSDLKMVRMMKERKPDLKVAFVGPQVQVQPEESLKASEDIDFVVRGEFDYAVVEFAQGRRCRRLPAPATGRTAGSSTIRRDRR